MSFDQVHRMSDIERTEQNNGSVDVNSARQLSIDFLRGIAVLGILLMNIVSFAMPEIAYYAPYSAALTYPGAAWANLQGADGIVRYFCVIFAEGKFISIFAMLFGAGLAIQSQHGQLMWRTVGEVRKSQSLRLIVLAIIGLIHAYFVWYGDILFSYAVVGLIAIWCVRRRRLWLISAASVLLILPTLLVMLLGAVMMLEPSGESLAASEDEMIHSAAEVASEIAAYTGTYHQQFEQRLPTAFYMQSVGLLFTGPYVLGLMLLGMALHGAGWFTNRPTRLHVVLSAVCFVLGTAGAIAISDMNRRYADSPMVQVMIVYPLFLLTAVLTAIAYSKGLVSLWFSIAGRLTNALECVGKMALSNYLLQSLLCTAFFYGYGLGYFASMGRTQLLVVVIVVWMINVLFSKLWLSKFSVGPVEWVWRRAVRSMSGTN